MSKHPRKVITASEISGICDRWMDVCKASHLLEEQFSIDFTKQLVTLSAKKGFGGFKTFVEIKITLRDWREFLTVAAISVEVNPPVPDLGLVDDTLFRGYRGIVVTMSKDYPELNPQSWQITCPANLVAFLREYDEIAKAYGKIQLFDSVHLY